MITFVGSHKKETASTITNLHKKSDFYASIIKKNSSLIINMLHFFSLEEKS